MDLRPHFLEAKLDLTAFKSIFQKDIKTVRSKIEQIVPFTLHNIAVDILICNDPYLIIPEIGMGGSCFKSALLSIAIEPENTNFLKSLKEGHFAQTIAHELHHAMRWASRGYGQTLGEAIVSEGLADYFATMITARPKPQWSQVRISKDILQCAKNEMLNDNYDHYAWFFGMGNFPRWIGYSIGYQLIELYSLKNRFVSNNGMIDVNANEILAMWPDLEKQILADTAKI